MFDELRDKLSLYAKRAGETASMLGVVMIAVPLAALVALAIGLLLSSAGIGLVAFFIVLAVILVWFKET